MAASQKVLAGDQFSRVCTVSAYAPNCWTNTSSAAMATTLLTTGAHMYQPKAPRAFRTCPTTV
jgi:hypothetical protein